MAWLTGWSYRKYHIIVYASGAGTLYQKRIKVHYSGTGGSGEDVYLNSHCRPDFGDVRFTDDDGTTLLDYWLEEKVDSDYAVFWVEVADDLSTVNRTIYVYYGKTDETTISNGDNTFIFFDGFDIDLSKWTEATGSSSAITAVVSGGLLDIYANVGEGFNEKCYYRQLADALSSYMVEARVKRSVDDPNQKFGIVMANDEGTFYNVSNGYFYYLEDWPTTERERVETLGSATGAGYTSFTIGTSYHRLAISRIGSNFAFYVDTVQKRTGTFSPTYNFIEVWVAGSYTDTHYYYDFIFIRKYVSPEPQHGDWGGEEVPVVPPTVTTQDATNIERY